MKKYLLFLLLVLFEFVFCCDYFNYVTQADEQLNKSVELLNDFIKKSGFKDTVDLLRFGTPELKQKDDKADEFDREGIKNDIKTETAKIKSRYFYVEVPYFTDELKVDGDNTSVRLVVPFNILKKLDNLEIKGIEFKNSMFKKASFKNWPLCHHLVNPQYAIVNNSCYAESKSSLDLVSPFNLNPTVFRAFLHKKSCFDMYFRP
ncbi:MAG: hypothetical protein LBJ00_06735, partial [Planctomycetaceae bacterium]|nr:hypothetical protein [Planctomycetaceae bacterium]